jgi:hypothetical protein
VQHLHRIDLGRARCRPERRQHRHELCATIPKMPTADRSSASTPKSVSNPIANRGSAIERRG